MWRIYSGWRLTTPFSNDGPCSYWESQRRNCEKNKTVRQTNFRQRRMSFLMVWLIWDERLQKSCQPCTPTEQRRGGHQQEFCLLKMVILSSLWMSHWCRCSVEQRCHYCKGLKNQEIRGFSVVHHPNVRITWVGYFWMQDYMREGIALRARSTAKSMEAE